MDHRAISNDRDLATVAQYFAFADLEQFRFAFDVRADAVATRVTHRRGSNVFEHRVEHVAHFAFIFRRHHNDVWNASKVRDVQQTVMRLSVTTGNAAAIETKLHVQILNADVVNHLIEAALKKRRIDRTDGLESLTRHARSKRDAMLLGNANVKRTFRKLLERFANARAVRHRSRQCDDLRILLHQLAKHIAENSSVGRRYGRALQRLACFQVKRPGCVPTIVIRFRFLFGLRKAFSFCSQRVNDDGAVLDLLGFVESRDERAWIMTVNVADVLESQFAYQR